MALPPMVGRKRFRSTKRLSGRCARLRRSSKRASLDLAIETLRAASQEEEERRDRYQQNIRLLFERRRDLALACHDGEAAAKAIIEMAGALHGACQAGFRRELEQQLDALFFFRPRA